MIVLGGDAGSIPAAGKQFVLAFVCLCYIMAAIAQLGERQTEDLKVPGSIPGLGIDSFGHSHICFSILNILQLLLHPFFFAESPKCLHLAARVKSVIFFVVAVAAHSKIKLPRPGIEPGTFRSSV